MSKIKVLVAGSALGAAILAGPAAAAVTGTVAATSEYTFRGIDSEGGAAIQGSLDWASGTGFYAGVWASNANPAPVGGNELDIYGGYKFKLSEGIELDVGGIYYLFSEDEETFAGTTANAFGIDYAELFAGVNVGGFSAKVYYTNDFFGGEDSGPGVDAESTYVNLSYTHTIKEGLTLKGAIGNQSGDGADAAYGDSVTDYALTLTKALENGFAASFGVVGTDLDNNVGGFLLGGGAVDDDPKFVVTLSKGFEI